jgi:hypothetical protein
MSQPVVSFYKRLSTAKKLLAMRAPRHGDATIAMFWIGQ